MDENWIKAVVLSADKDRLIEKILDVRFDSFVPQGNNYLSQILRASMTAVLVSGENKEKRVIIKKGLKDKNLDVLNVTSLFKCETKMYLEVLYHMENLMEEFGDKRDKLWCKMFGYNPYDIIVLEDLADQGFVAADRKSGLDLSHGLLAVGSLARFHAMSKILMARGLLSADDLEFSHKAPGSTIDKAFYQGGFKQFSHAIGASWPQEWKHLAEKIEAQADVASEKVTKLDEETAEKYLVLNHGDYWTCNVLFKYFEGEKNKPSGIRFVDFQNANIGSYMSDFVFFVYTSIVPTIRREHIGQMLTEYHKQLVSALQFYGFTGSQPSINELWLEYERLQYVGFAVASIERAIMVAEVGEAFDLVKMHGGTPHNAFNPKIFSSEKFIADTLPDFINFMKNGIL